MSDLLGIASAINRLLTLLTPEDLTKRLAQAFKQVGIGSVEMLSNDERVKKAAKITYSAMPLPIALALGFTIGEEGFERLVFKVRDMMLATGSMQMPSLNREWLKDALISFMRTKNR